MVRSAAKRMIEAGQNFLGSFMERFVIHVSLYNVGIVRMGFAFYKEMILIMRKAALSLS